MPAQSVGPYSDLAVQQDAPGPIAIRLPSPLLLPLFPAQLELAWLPAPLGSARHASAAILAKRATSQAAIKFRRRYPPSCCPRGLTKNIAFPRMIRRPPELPAALPTFRSR